MKMSNCLIANDFEAGCCLLASSGRHLRQCLEGNLMLEKTLKPDLGSNCCYYCYTNVTTTALGQHAQNSDVLGHLLLLVGKAEVSSRIVFNFRKVVIILAIDHFENFYSIFLLSSYHLHCLPMVKNWHR